jgi:hypothetical protein
MNNDRKYELFGCGILVLVIAIIILWCAAPADAFELFPKSEPTVTNVDTWTPMDKCWAMQPHDAGYSGVIVYFVTYVNQNGQHKIEQVDIDTWYASPPIVGRPDNPWPHMYYQGGRA